MFARGFFAVWLGGVVVKSALVLVAIVLGVVVFQVYINNVVLNGFAQATKDALDTFDQKAIDISIESVRNLTTMATLVLGAVGAFWFTKYSSTTMPRKVWSFGLAAALFAGLSIYFGFIFERSMVTMLMHRMVALRTSWLVWPLYAEEATFLLSLFALGVVVFEG
jgi:hypothetical protein